MIRIAIIDDNAMFLGQLREKVRSVLDGSKLAGLIHCYDSMEAMPDSILTDADIFFLDMDFQGKDYSGVDIARNIRSSNQKAILIFVTNYIEYAPEGYEVQAFRYILKSDLEHKLESCLLQAMSKLQSVRETVQFQISREPLTLPLSDILYMESQGHTVLIHVDTPGSDAAETHKMYSSLAELEQKMLPLGFLRIHKSYLVNMQRIRKYQYNTVILDNGTTLQASEKNYAENKKQYLLWKGKQ